MKHRLGHIALAVDCEAAVEMLLHDIGGEYRLINITRFIHSMNLHPGKCFLQRLLQDMADRGKIRNVGKGGNCVWTWNYPPDEYVQLTLPGMN